MIATFIYLFCMLLIPRTFKNAGIQYVVQDKNQGVWLILVSKTLWWVALINIVLIWLPTWQTYMVILGAIGLTFSLYKDRNYILFEWQGFKKEEYYMQRAKY